MATMTQLDTQIAKLQIQRDAVLQQVNKIEQQESALRKQMISANDAQKAKLSAQLALLAQNKMKLAGTAMIQTEDGEAGAVAMAPSAAVTTTTAGNVSTMGGSGNFPMRWGTDKKSSKLNVMQRVKQTESIYTYVDNLGSVE